MHISPLSFHPKSSDFDFWTHRRWFSFHWFSVLIMTSLTTFEMFWVLHPNWRRYKWYVYVIMYTVNTRFRCNLQTLLQININITIYIYTPKDWTDWSESSAWIGILWKRYWSPKHADSNNNSFHEWFQYKGFYYSWMVCKVLVLLDARRKFTQPNFWWLAAFFQPWETMRTKEGFWHTTRSTRTCSTSPGLLG